MAYTIPTAAELKALFPAFAAVDDAIVTDAIAAGTRRVDETWTEGDYTRAIMLYACHYMTLQGLGTGEGSGGGSGNAAYRQIRSGQLSLTRYARGEQNGDDGSLLGSTMYGRMFMELLGMNFVGIKTVAADVGPVSGYAKDWPPFYWMP